jgi:bifunctional non-homologous end joining protein LigD
MAHVEVEVGGRQLKLSNLDKVLYPAAGFTKAQVIDYYTRVGPVLLPYLRDRPLTLKRYPDGVEAGHFYEKNCPKHRPDWVETAAIRRSRRDESDINYCLVQDLPTLVWAANLASIELHTTLGLASDIEQPTMLVFDLDPGAPADLVQCCQVGLWLRELFENMGLRTFPKTSGSKGLQVYLPINAPISYEATKPFALAVAQNLEEEHGDLVVSNMAKNLREGKVLVDWSQNDEHKTTVSVYSLRARPRPTPSTPVSWEEVEMCFKKRNPGLLVFDAEQVLVRLEKKGDLFAPVLALQQDLMTHE